MNTRPKHKLDHWHMLDHMRRIEDAVNVHIEPETALYKLRVINADEVVTEVEASTFEQVIERTYERWYSPFAAETAPDPTDHPRGPKQKPRHAIDG